jgi:serine/threonine protein kinase
VNTVPPAGLVAALSGRYTVEREIGAGGMATVYLARDLRHNRKVALKVLQPELSAVIGSERLPKRPSEFYPFQLPFPDLLPCPCSPPSPRAARSA